MINEIKYGGYTAQPSDYESPDGDLAMSLNLLNHDGSLTPIATPTTVFTPPAGMDVIYIHALPDGRKNYIMHSSTAGALSYDNPDDETAAVAIDTPADLGRVLDVTSVGNTLIIAYEKYLCYILWRDNKYDFLGNRPDFVPIEFGLKEVGFGNVEGFEFKINISESDYEQFKTSLPQPNGSGAYTPHPSVSNSSPTDYAFEALTNAVYGRLYERYNEYVKSRGLHFYQPFMVRYAFRLYDGTYRWHSSPVLMLPTTVYPLLRASESKYSNGIYSNRISFADFQLFRLVYRILDKGAINQWRDIIQGIDIFISAPIYTYDQSGKISGASSVNFSTYSGVWHDNETPRLNGIFSSKTSYDDSYHYVVAPNGKGATSAVNYWTFPSREKELSEDIRSCHQFYRVARIDLDKIEAMQELKPLEFEDGVTVDNLVGRPLLPDEFQSHHILKPNILHSYNNRLDMADMKISLMGALPLRSMMTYCNPSSHSSASSYRVSMRIKFRKNGEEFTSTLSSSGTGDTELDAMAVDSFINYPPRYLYIPDADAKQLEVALTPVAGGDTVYVTFPLTPHDFLNGAYYFAGFELTPDGDSPLVTSAASGFPASDRSEVIRRNRLYVSEPDNPFVFSPQSVVSVGSARIKGVSTAARALSQGQFGQYPLYAFTDEGVWALEVSSTGVYSARQPITRDVCRNISGITQLDSSVLFPSDRGIMMIAGSDTQCISDVINSDHPFDISSLPAMNDLRRLIGHGNPDTCMPTLPFLKFIDKCAMSYDYTNQRVFIFNPTVDYAYVLSLKSRQWAIVHSDFSYGLNSYPEAIVARRDSSLVNLSAKSDTFPSGLLVTRPIKLDAPDILKTVDTVIQRGYFRRGHVRSVLYGSRDLYNWSLVWSSKDHYLRGFSGSPYKYFRIALLCDLSEGESLYGATVQFEPRKTNQPR